MNSDIARSTTRELLGLLATMPDPAGCTQVDALEHELAARFGTRHAVAVASGTAALHTALECLGIGPGDHVLVPALSVVMSVAPVLYVGARPVFVDCTPDGTDFDHVDLAAKITPAAKAVVPVYLWGRPGDPNRLAEVAALHGLDVIVDACQAQGTAVGSRAAGTQGKVGCFSMKDGKVLSCGEGGYLFTDDDAIAGRARSFRSHNQPPPINMQAPKVGHNYRLAEPLALIARTNLRRFDDLLIRRRHQATRLREMVAGTPGIDMVHAPDTYQWNGHSFLATLTVPESRAFCAHLARCGVPNSVGTFRLVPADQRPEFVSYVDSPCRNAAALVDHTLAVMLTDHDDEERIGMYAKIIVEEARRWRHRS